MQAIDNQSDYELDSMDGEFEDGKDGSNYWEDREYEDEDHEEAMQDEGDADWTLQKEQAKFHFRK